jgi:hypothetical protein
MAATTIDFQAGAPVAGSLDVNWIHGSPSKRRNADPPIQVHAYDAHTFILRQNKAIHYEAPFVYLFFGNDRALLLDTGATADHDKFPLRATVDALLDRWLSEQPRSSYELIVAHTHAHSDHVAGDNQFNSRPSTTVVPADLDSVRSFFAFAGEDGVEGVGELVCSVPDEDLERSACSPSSVSRFLACWAVHAPSGLGETPRMCP